MKKTGFTLIELMIVLAIVGILASVIVPACSKQTGNTGSHTTTEQGQQSNQQSEKK